MANDRPRRALAVPGPLLLSGVARHQSAVCPVNLGFGMGDSPTLAHDDRLHNYFREIGQCQFGWSVLYYVTHLLNSVTHYQTLII